MVPHSEEVHMASNVNVIIEGDFSLYIGRCKPPAFIRRFARSRGINCYLFDVFKPAEHEMKPPTLAVTPQRRDINRLNNHPLIMLALSFH